MLGNNLDNLKTTIILLSMLHDKNVRWKYSNSFSLKLRGQLPLVLVCLIRDMGISKCVQMMILGWSWHYKILYLGNLHSCGSMSGGLEYRLKIKRTDWLLANTCPQAANHCVLFWVWEWTPVYNLEAWFDFFCFVFVSVKFMGVYSVCSILFGSSKVTYLTISPH